MKTQQFLDHHGVASNPFADEDAQTDPIFKDHCIGSTYHPAWDKVFGSPADPSTSIVFGEKGSGKTALRLQIIRHLTDYNRAHPSQRLFVVEYDEFNPYLDRFTEQLSSRRRRPDQILKEWELWDHMDAILSLGVTQLVDRILLGPRTESNRAIETRPTDVGPLDLNSLDRQQARDLLLLAACYDQSASETFQTRWHRLRRKLKFRTWRTLWPQAVGILAVLVVFGVIAAVGKSDWLASPWPYLMAAAGWIPWAVQASRGFWSARGIQRQLKVIHRDANPLRRVLSNFRGEELAEQPLPNLKRTDDRFKLLGKFQGVLSALGFGGVIVLVDRVDEPQLINGRPELMRALIWPMLDNMFLGRPGIGLKLLLPRELSYYIDRESTDFYQRARLDKHNLVSSLEWSGEALYDVANARLNACAANGQSPSLRKMFVDSVSDRRLIDALRTLRVPRHLFKFLHRLLVSHCNAHTDEAPSWQISGETFESVLALYQRDQDAFDRGLGAG